MLANLLGNPPKNTVKLTLLGDDINRRLPAYPKECNPLRLTDRMPGMCQINAEAAQEAQKSFGPRCQGRQGATYRVGGGG